MLPANWKGVPVLVTGAGGFIGSHLAEALARRGAKVRAMVRYNSRNHWGKLQELPGELLKRVDVFPGDIADPFLVREAARGREAVFHLAALIGIPYSYSAPESYVRTNVLGTLNVLEACLAARVRKLVHTSTSEVYGTARYVPIDEEHPLRGQSPYSASKIGADHMAESFHRSFDLPVAVLRPFNTFGPRQSARAVIPAILSQLLSGASELRVGSLSPMRDFTYVEDTVAGFLAAAASPASVGQVVNLGTGRGVTVRRLAELAMRLTGRKARLLREGDRVRPAKSEVLRLVASNRKAGKLLGWAPRRRLESGLRLVAEYIRDHPDEYKPGLYAV